MPPKKAGGKAKAPAAAAETAAPQKVLQTRSSKAGLQVRSSLLCLCVVVGLSPFHSIPRTLDAFRAFRQTCAKAHLGRQVWPIQLL